MRRHTACATDLSSKSWRRHRQVHPVDVMKERAHLGMLRGLGEGQNRGHTGVDALECVDPIRLAAGREKRGKFGRLPGPVSAVILPFKGFVALSL